MREFEQNNKYTRNKQSTLVDDPSSVHVKNTFFCGKTQKDSFGSLRNFQGYSNSKDLAVYTSQQHILDNVFELRKVKVLTF